MRTQPQLLLVEDDGATRDLYRHALNAAGYTTTAVEDGYDALRYLEHHRPDAVVLDLVLPRVGGLDVYTELKANPRTQMVPVIVVTGTDVPPLEAAGFRYFLRKPVIPEVLLGTVENALRRSGSRAST